MYKIYETLRDERGLSDYAVAKATGIPAPTFTRWKQGVAEPNGWKVKKLAELFGVPMDTFYAEEVKV